MADKTNSYERRTWWTRYDLTARLTDAAFLEAAVTGAFLIAAADGHADEVEHDALLDRLEILGGVDRDIIDDHLTEAARALEETEFAAVIGRCAALVPSKEAAEAAMMLAMAVALADDDVSKEEREIASQLATAIGLPGLDLDSMIVELRGQ